MAAPGRILGGSRTLPDARLSLTAGDSIFAAPYFESIVAITDCRIDESGLVTDALVPRLSCRAHRLTRDRGAQGTTGASLCTAAMRLELAGVWAEVDGRRRYVPLRRDQFETIGRKYENMLQRLPGAGLQ